MNYWKQGWRCLFETIAALQPPDLNSTVTVRGESLSVPLAIARSLSHCGYHVGQIVLISRILADNDWKTLTIHKGKSQQHNAQNWGDTQYLKLEPRRNDQNG